MTTAEQMPELPKSSVRTDSYQDGYGAPAYTADDMHAYARAYAAQEVAKVTALCEGDAALRIELAIQHERERCRMICVARMNKIAEEADRAAEREPEEVSALRAMAWQLEVTAHKIAAPPTTDPA